uniref:Uncharacterized protein n=1 Tax=Phakopsora pachyrhizi TaxID=170000 RepID=A0A0S1MJS1_PHAPC
MLKRQKQEATMRKKKRRRRSLKISTLKFAKSAPSQKNA